MDSLLYRLTSQEQQLNDISNQLVYLKMKYSNLSLLQNIENVRNFLNTIAALKLKLRNARTASEALMAEGSAKVNINDTFIAEMNKLISESMQKQPPPPEKIITSEPIIIKEAPIIIKPDAPTIIGKPTLSGPGVIFNIESDTAKLIVYLSSQVQEITALKTNIYSTNPSLTTMPYSPTNPQLVIVRSSEQSINVTLAQISELKTKPKEFISKKLATYNGLVEQNKILIKNLTKVLDDLKIPVAIIPNPPDNIPQIPVTMSDTTTTSPKQPPSPWKRNLGIALGFLALSAIAITAFVIYKKHKAIKIK